jgi:hypothetical protein
MGYGFGVSGDHDDLNAETLKCRNGFTGLRSYFVRQLKCTDHLAVYDHVKDDGAIRSPTVRDGDLPTLEAFEQSRTADVNLSTFDRGRNTFGWSGCEPSC